jgi:hypothetical protein
VSKGTINGGGGGGRCKLDRERRGVREGREERKREERERSERVRERSIITITKNC